MLSRRAFLRTGGALMLGAALNPAWLLPAAASQPPRVLVLIQLAGGNDGLNTVVPYSHPVYRTVRPNIAYGRAEVFALEGAVGLNRGLGRLYPLYEKGNVAVVQSLGYERPDRSHFVSTDIWHSARTPPVQNQGWLGTLADLVAPADCDPSCRHPLAYGALLPLAMRARSALGGCATGVDEFAVNGPTETLSRLRQIYDVPDQGDRETVRRLTQVGLESLSTMHALAARIKTPVQYPYTGFAQFLRLGAQMIAEGLAPPVFHAIIGGFDTHADQHYQHEKSLQILADGVAAFCQDLEVRGLDDRVVCATYSEFGRRVHENASRGTDHGAAAPHFVIGSPVRGGFYGTAPDLGHLVHGDLPYHTDFRTYYATLLQWMRCRPEAVLGRPFPVLPFV